MSEETLPFWHNVEGTIILNNGFKVTFRFEKSDVSGNLDGNLDVQESFLEKMSELMDIITNFPNENVIIKKIKVDPK